MSRGTRTGRRKPVRAPRRPRHPYKPHRWHLGEAGVCVHCPLPKQNPVHDEAAIAAAEAERDQAQAEHQRRAGDR